MGILGKIDLVWELCQKICLISKRCNYSSIVGCLYPSPIDELMSLFAKNTAVADKMENKAPVR